MNQRTVDAIALSLAEALLVEVLNRAKERKDGALISRLNRALVQIEEGCYCIPATAVDATVCTIAAYVGDLLSARLQAIVQHGGLRRGEADVDRFVEDMLARLNDPKNVAKGDYRLMPWPAVREKIKEEHGEVEAEMWKLSIGQGNTLSAIREFADLAVISLIGAVKVMDGASHEVKDCPDQVLRGMGIEVKRGDCERCFCDECHGC